MLAGGRPVPSERPGGTGMKPYVVKVPDIGEGIAEVELVAWHVQVGDLVTEDQSLADVMTDKATVEVPAPVGGRILALGGEVGQLLAVGGELVRIETTVAAGAAGAAAAPAPAPEQGTQAAAAPAPAPAPAATPRPAPPPAPAPAAAPVPTAAAQAPPAHRPAAPAGQRPIASPSVRARAWELGIELATVRASGPAGRIMQSDLDAHAAAAPPAARPPQSPPPARPLTATAARAVPVGDATETLKVVGLRRKIAEKMQLSKRRIPHYTYVEEIDVSEVEALRARMNARWGAQRGKLTLLPFLVRAVVVAVGDFPQVNARFDDEAGVLTRHQAVHMGMATQTDAGLMVPVMRDAQTHDLWRCAAEVTRLADAARSGRIVREELSGSTITITSLGKLGGIVSTPVINHPEVAIVGVNRIVERPMIVSGAVVPRLMMNLSSSFDHRVVDGAVAAGFIQRVREMLEHPGLLFTE